tara:strand:- start:612 stop:749 length:138 start_codon:yes stop_codon:yes gene_type:complete
MSRLDRNQRTLLELETVLTLARDKGEYNRDELIKELLIIIDKAYE